MSANVVERDLVSEVSESATPSLRVIIDAVEQHAVHIEDNPEVADIG